MQACCRYLGLFSKEIEAAQAYDRESVRSKGLKAITNFDICEYLDLLSAQLPRRDHTNVPDRLLSCLAMTAQ